MGRAKTWTSDLTVVQPFELHTEKRRLNPGIREDPILMVELMIAPGKVANIAIRRGDNPTELAKVFGMTYSLN